MRRLTLLPLLLVGCGQLSAEIDDERTGTLADARGSARGRADVVRGDGRDAEASQPGLLRASLAAENARLRESWDTLRRDYMTQRDELLSLREGATLAVAQAAGDADELADAKASHAREVEELHERIGELEDRIATLKHEIDLLKAEPPAAPAEYTGWIKFSRPGCAPCRTMDARLKRWEADHPELVVQHVDTATDEGKALATRYGVTAYPTFLYVVSGRATYHLTGSFDDVGKLLGVYERDPATGERYPVCPDCGKRHRPRRVSA